MPGWVWGVVAATVVVGVLVLLLILVLEPRGDGVASTDPVAAAEFSAELGALPGGRAEPPDWVATLDAPFDVDEFFVVVPDERNAAPLYLDALYEFSPHCADCFTNTGDRTRIARERSDRILEMHEQVAKSGELPSDAGRFLTELEPAFRKLEAVQEREACVFYTGLSPFTLIPHVSDLWRTAQALELRGRHRVETGDLDGAVNNVETMLRMHRYLRPRGPLLAQMAALDGLRPCFDGTLPGLLGSRRLTVQHCDTLAARIRETVPFIDEAFVTGMQAQYLNDCSMLHELQTRTGHFAGVQRGVKLKELFDLGGGPSAAHLEVYVTRMTAADYAAARALVREIYAGALDARTLPHTHRHSQLRTLGRLAKRRNDVFMALFAPGLEFLGDATTRAEARIRIAACLVAARRWHLEHGDWPTSLDSALDAANLSGLGVDPYTNQPLRFSTNPEVTVSAAGPPGRPLRISIDLD